MWRPTVSYPKCTRCVEEYVLGLEKAKDPDKADWEGGMYMPLWRKVNDAVTEVPAWQTKEAGFGQVVMACIMLPCCLRHIGRDESAHKLASALAIPGVPG